MQNKRLLLFSSSRAGNSGFLETAKPVIKEFLGNAPLRIAFIPFASVQKDHESYTQMVRDALGDQPYIVDAVLPRNATAIIENADVIMTGGGNTFKLLHDLYSYRLIDVIRSKVNNRAPYIGWSAGSNIAGLTICTTNDMPVIEPESFTALGLVPFQINPHYYNVPIEGFNGETRDQRLTEFLIVNPGIKIVGLREGTALKSDGGQLHFIGETKAIVFERADENGVAVTREIAPADDLRFLTEE